MTEAVVVAPSNVLITPIEQSTTEWSASSEAPNFTQQGPDWLALADELAELPAWLQTPFCRFLRLKQRNWPAKTVQRATRQLFSRLFQMMDFFIQQYAWQSWDQLSLRWLEDYIDARLRQGLAPPTINWDLINFRVLCRFLLDEGYDVPPAILRLKLLDTPRRLPRPLSNDQIRPLEQCIQAAVKEAKSDYRRQLALRDLACFYLLWHCGLRISEACSLLVSEVDLEGRKLFVRNSKERKDRVVYVSDTAIKAVSQYLAIRHHPEVPFLFTSQRGTLTPNGLQIRLKNYGQQCGVPVTAQRLRHTFASQMLAARTPVTSLQRYLGHEQLDTTMLYAEVSDPMLQQDYYHGIAVLDPASAQLTQPTLNATRQEQLRQLLAQLKSPALDPFRQQEILVQMQELLDTPS